MMMRLRLLPSLWRVIYGCQGSHHLPSQLIPLQVGCFQAMSTDQGGGPLLHLSFSPSLWEEASPRFSESSGKGPSDLESLSHLKISPRARLALALRWMLGTKSPQVRLRAHLEMLGTEGSRMRLRACLEMLGIESPRVRLRARLEMLGTESSRARLRALLEMLGTESTWARLRTRLEMLENVPPPDFWWGDFSWD
ncbi:hypothetical protein B296_00010410 [Ensete ventricosum]|uniref:Uncharacterized protein n=1 Tax=Ensete ventricosum TaxID=4639 RepID=A0A426Z2Y2_ENSVE|nr:hypothetical protein B296_00010410 [Ensete ventricosum]